MPFLAHYFHLETRSAIATVICVLIDRHIHHSIKELYLQNLHCFLIVWMVGIWRCTITFTSTILSTMIWSTFLSRLKMRGQRLSVPRCAADYAPVGSVAFHDFLNDGGVHSLDLKSDGVRGREGSGMGPPKGGGPDGWGAQNFALFYFPFPATVSLFSCLSGVLSWNFGCFGTPEP